MSNLEIRRVNLPEATAAQGVVIVIDVIRAFSVAAYAFSRGAQRLWLVVSVEDAFALREREPDALLACEVGGRLIPGFDFNNSPSLMAIADINVQLLIQRTGAGTQGAVGAVNATHLLIDDKAAILDIDRFDFVMVGTHKHWRGITYVEVEKVNV